MPDNRITIALPPDGRWLHFAQDSLHRYAVTVGFSDRLEQMCTNSVLEACEELFRLAGECGIREPVRLLLDYKGEAVVIDVEYNARIPLNPQETDEYEVPDQDAELDGLDLGALWLHMIKRRMDRVRFAVRGQRRTLRMIKYRRDAGKERQAWVMAVKPSLRKGLVLHLDDENAEHPSSMLQAPGRGALRLGPSETFLVQRMDGEASFHDLYMAHIDALGLTSPQALAALYEQLENLDMLTTGEKPQRSLLRRIVRTVITPDFTLKRADSIISTLHTYLRPLMHPIGFLFLLGVGLSGLVPLAEHHQAFHAVLIGLEQRLLDQPWLLAPLYMLLLLHVGLHELAHGLTCKHFGGRVPRLGAMFYLGSFIFYCDTTAAWNFPQRRARLLVSLAGPLLSFAVLGLAVWAAGMAVETASFWEPVLVCFCLLTVFGLLMNFNPFVKMDAYYMLLDITGIANLRLRSFRFLERKLFGWLGVGSSEDVRVTPREKRIFWWYGIAGTLGTLLFLAMPALKFAHTLSSHSASNGKLLLTAVLAVLFLTRMGNLAFAKVRAMRHREYKIQ